MAKEQKVYTKWLATKLVKAGYPVVRVELMFGFLRLLLNFW